MSQRGPRIHDYAGGEFMLAYGETSGPQLLVLQPLFEEMNRCRMLITSICRALTDSGIGCWLSDLPGTGESPRGPEMIRWSDGGSAVQAAAAVIEGETGRAPAIAAFRGGALLDRAISAPAWRLAPTSGRSLLSDLRRSAIASGSDPAHPAGYTLSPDLAEALAAADAEASPAARTVRLATDDRPADARIEGLPLWRRPEPDFDAATAEAIARDIADWIMA